MTPSSAITATTSSSAASAAIHSSAEAASTNSPAAPAQTFSSRISSHRKKEPRTSSVRGSFSLVVGWAQPTFLKSPDKQHLPIRRQRPQVIGHDRLQLIAGLAKLAHRRQH